MLDQRQRYIHTDHTDRSFIEYLVGEVIDTVQHYAIRHPTIYAGPVTREPYKVVSIRIYTNHAALVKFGPINKMDILPQFLIPFLMQSIDDHLSEVITDCGLSEDAITTEYAPGENVTTEMWLRVAYWVKFKSP